jgi:hypothetical protein
MLIDLNPKTEPERQIVFQDHTPPTNLQLTLLNKLGIPAEKLGDSTGEFKELSELP